jgi:hypothetical protein
MMIEFNFSSNKSLLLLFFYLFEACKYKLKPRPHMNPLSENHLQVNPYRFVYLLLN